MKRIISSATAVVVLTATMLAASSLAVSAQDYYGQYASEGQAGCDWYWAYRFNESGGWEWWCWDPELGWWYGQNESGSKQVIAPKTSGSGPLVFSI